MLRVAALSLLLVFSPGCMFGELQRNLDQLDTMARLPVEVSSPAGLGGPRYAVLLTPVGAAGPLAMTVSNFGVFPSDGELELPVATGRHYLVGFQDVDGNGVFDPGEPAGRFGDPTLLDLAPGETHEPVGLSLTVEGGSADAWPAAFSAAAEEATLQPYLPVLGDVVPLDDPRFDEEVGAKSLWSPAAFLAAGGRAGTTFLHAYDPGKPVVLLVHGVGGTPRDLAPLVPAIEAAGAQAWCFYYPAAPSLAELGAFLARQVHVLRGTRGVDSLTIVAHSMGGLVARRAVGDLAASGDARAIDALVTVATPFGGVASAAIGVNRAPAVAPAGSTSPPGATSSRPCPARRCPTACRTRWSSPTATPAAAARGTCPTAR